MVANRMPKVGDCAGLAVTGSAMWAPGVKAQAGRSIIES